MKQPQKRKKIKGNKLDKSLLKVLGINEGLYVSAFVGGIKKKHSPTTAFETNIVSYSVFEQKIVSKFFLLI